MGPQKQTPTPSTHPDLEYENQAKSSLISNMKIWVGAGGGGFFSGQTSALPKAGSRPGTQGRRQLWAGQNFPCHALALSCGQKKVLRGRNLNWDGADGGGNKTGLVLGIGFRCLFTDPICTAPIRIFPVLIGK